MTLTPLPPFQVKFNERRREFQDYLPLIERIQTDLKDDADELGSQEGWDQAAQRGVAAWLEDQDNIFRFLKRNGWDEAKAYSLLLDAMSNRVTHSLHLPITPVVPYADSALFHILPLPRYTDRLGRPIAVISPREVVRDAEGGLEGLTQWLWSASEMLRRTVTDYWHSRRWNAEQKGYGGEGCVAIVDARGTGYRNLEVELLPAFSAIGYKNFPGLVDAVYIVNAGWTQRSLWSVVKNIIPRTAQERITFISSPSELEEVFDLDRVPQFLGGRDPYGHDPQNNPIQQYYQSHSIGAITDTSLSFPRTASFASAAEVFYTAENTPASTPFLSRRPSMMNVQTLPVINTNKYRVTAVPTTPPTALTPAPAEHYLSPLSPARSPIEDHLSHASSDPSWLSSDRTHGSMTPLQRIRSLADFKLYLSPSRRAQVELLESDDEAPSPVPNAQNAPPAPPALPRRILRPAMCDPSFPSRAETLAARRTRPPLRLLGVPGHLRQECVRTYSDRIASHHARGLQELDVEGNSPIKFLTVCSPGEGQGQGQGQNTTSKPIPVVTTTTSPTSPTSAPFDLSTRHAQSTPIPTQAISAYSRSSNPWYGYPAVRRPDPTHPGHTSIEPVYPRRRKRDLIKTLLFLFLIRLQSLRDAFERTLGLNRLLPWVGFRQWSVPTGPREGLIQEAEHERYLRQRQGGQGAMRRKGLEGDWAWMVVGFMLMRGTWTRLLALPLEAIGLEGVRDLLGLGI